ncbi:Methionine--tRNA ligase, mitochondrial [Sparganum proliferum]
MRSIVSFITTPIFYVNASPHIGHAYTLCIADAWARYTRLRGHPCTQAFANPATNLIRPLTEDTASSSNILFSTGVDEHGCKIARAAQSIGCTPQSLCDRVASQFEELCAVLHVKPSVFIRTTDKVHMRNVQHIWERLEAGGFFYWNTFAGWYCAADEAFYADWELEEADQNGKKLAKASGNAVEWVEEETCRFRLKQFKPDLHRWLDSGVLPTGSHEHARLLQLTHESLDLLEDPSVSRPATRVPWGIPVPNRPDQTIYVWFDALVNYLTAAGMYSDRLDNLSAWPPTVQFIGKDIMRFHTILWPALLLAVGLPLPQRIIPHAHLLVDGIKMSKSLGNVLSSSQVIEYFSARMQNGSVKSEDSLRAIAADCLRYCLIRSVCLNEDSTFSLAHAERTVNTELVNPLGNLLSRVISHRLNPEQEVYFINGSDAEHLLSKSDLDLEFLHSLQSLSDKFDNLWWHQLLPNRSIDLLQDVLRKTNAFIERHRPWSAGFSHLSRTEVLGVCLESLRLIACFLDPVIPRLSSSIFQQLGVDSNDVRKHESSRPLYKGRHGPLIPRLQAPTTETRRPTPHPHV